MLLFLTSMENKIYCKGELHLGDFTIPCYVLEDGRRVLSARGMQIALNMADEDNRTSARLNRYLNQETLKPFIYKDKSVGHFEPLICHDGSAKINGYEATVLIDICDAFLEALRQLADEVEFQNSRTISRTLPQTQLYDRYLLHQNCCQKFF